MLGCEKNPLQTDLFCGAQHISFGVSQLTQSSRQDCRPGWKIARRWAAFTGCGCAVVFLGELTARRWFQIFFIFTPIWGRFPIWLIFFRWVETTNQTSLRICCWNIWWYGASGGGDASSSWGQVIICNAWEVIYQSPWKVQQRNWKMKLFKHCRCKGNNEGNVWRGAEILIPLEVLNDDDDDDDDGGKTYHLS